MTESSFYRYFLGFRPHPLLRQLLAKVAARAGQRPQLELLHLTACVIAECQERDAFLGRQVAAALSGHALSSFPICFGRVQGGPNGAFLSTKGKQDEIQDFYRMLQRLLIQHGILPLYRESGLHPHVTLGYTPCLFDQFEIALEWSPDELLLIESEVGKASSDPEMDARAAATRPVRPRNAGRTEASWLIACQVCPIADFG